MHERDVNDAAISAVSAVRLTALRRAVSLWRPLVFIAMLFLLSYGAALFLPLPQIPYAISPGEMVLHEGRMLLIVLAATFVMAGIERRGLSAYGLGRPRAISRLCMGSICGVLLSSLLVGTVAAAHYLKIRGPVPDIAPAAWHCVAWLLAYLMVGLTEETLFRGYLQRSLGETFGFWPAAVVLSLGFGLVHLMNHPVVPFQAVSAASIGLVFSLSLRLSGSLWWNIGFHAAWDWAQAFIFGTMASGHVLEGRLLRSSPAGDVGWSGGPAGPDSGYLFIPFLGLAAAAAVLSCSGAVVFSSRRAKPGADLPRVEDVTPPVAS